MSTSMYPLGSSITLLVLIVNARFRIGTFLLEYLVLSLNAQPRRLNYVLFIQQLIDTTSPGYRDGYDSDRRVIGLDMYVHFNIHVRRLTSMAKWYWIIVHLPASRLSAARQLVFSSDGNRREESVIRSKEYFHQ
jgi:hypothetical protein